MESGSRVLSLLRISCSFTFCFFSLHTYINLLTSFLFNLSKCFLFCNFTTWAYHVTLYIMQNVSFWPSSTAFFLILLRRTDRLKWPKFIFHKIIIGLYKKYKKKLKVFALWHASLDVFFPILLTSFICRAKPANFSGLGPTVKFSWDRSTPLLLYYFSVFCLCCN